MSRASAYALALADDVQWRLHPGPEYEYPDTYARLRDAAARTAERTRHRRGAVRRTVGPLRHDAGVGRVGVAPTRPVRPASTDGVSSTDAARPRRTAPSTVGSTA